MSTIVRSRDLSEADRQRYGELAMRRKADAELTANLAREAEYDANACNLAFIGKTWHEQKKRK